MPSSSFSLEEDADTTNSRGGESTIYRGVEIASLGGAKTTGLEETEATSLGGRPKDGRLPTVNDTTVTEDGT